MSFGALLFGLAIYFAPTLIAYAKKHKNRGPIFTVNLFLGWTFIGWGITFLWSILK